METKVCKICKETKLLSDFSKHKSTKDGLNSWCKVCISNYSKNRYHKDPTKFKNENKQYVQKNKDKVKIQKDKWVYKKQGVYGWFDGDLVLYIGQSKQLNSRISKHKTWLKNIPSSPERVQYLYKALQQHKNASIRIIEECPPEVLLERESYYINTLKPLYNRGN